MKLHSNQAHWLPVVIILFGTVAVVMMATTRNLSSGDHKVFENTTLNFMITVVPDEWVDVSCRRWWANVWPGGSKCVAGFNVPVAGHQVKFAVLRWNWKR
jgi:hypothetical protein